MWTKFKPFNLGPFIVHFRHTPDPWITQAKTEHRYCPWIFVGTVTSKDNIRALNVSLGSLILSVGKIP